MREHARVAGLLRDDQAVTRAIHLHPERMRAHAATAAQLADALAALGAPPGAGTGTVADVLSRARRELADLESVLLDHAAAVERADVEAAWLLRRAGA